MDIQTFDLCPYVSKVVVGYGSHSAPYVGFQLPKIVVFDQVDEVRNHFPHTMFRG
jgi:hypothetical protein